MDTYIKVDSRLTNKHGGDAGTKRFMDRVLTRPKKIIRQLQATSTSWLTSGHPGLNPTSPTVDEEAPSASPSLAPSATEEDTLSTSTNNTQTETPQLQLPGPTHTSSATMLE